MINKIKQKGSINIAFQNKLLRIFENFMIIICLITILFTVYVGIPVSYKLLYSHELIESIQLVEVFVEGKKEYSYIIINEIEDIDEFIDDFTQLKYKWHLGGPAPIEFNTIAFKINYAHGEYEVFDYGGRYTYQIDKGIQTRGYGSFKENEFNQLINKYKY